MGSERVEGWGVEGGDPPELTWFSEWCRKWQQNLYSTGDSINQHLEMAAVCSVQCVYLRVACMLLAVQCFSAPNTLLQ